MACNEKKSNNLFMPIKKKKNNKLNIALVLYQIVLARAFIGLK